MRMIFLRNLSNYLKAYMLSDMASFFDLIFIMVFSSALAAQNFVSVSVCPRDNYTWGLESAKKKCQGDTPDYLCAALENQVGKFGEICTKFGLTPAKKCAVLNEQTKNLDSVDCKADSGCPTDPYIPSVLWKYQICFKDFYGTTTTVAPTTTPTIASATASPGNETVWDGSGDGGSGSGAGVVVPVVIILIIVVVVMVVFYGKNLFGFRDKVQQLFTDLRKCFQDRGELPDDPEKGEAQSTQVPLINQDVKENETNSEKVTNISNTGGIKEEGHKEKPVFSAKPEKTKTKKEKVTNTSKTSDTKEDGHQGKHDETEMKREKLKELLKYLVHILKQELCVNDLKEKAVIHSKSINEHFTEPIIKDMVSVSGLDDYSQLDTSLVLTLLCNFCEGIKAPSRGWDYEPRDDETHVGADIERIRLMWNKYCDNDLHFKHLDDVYNRMKQKFGTVAVHGDDGVKKSPHEIKEKDEGFDLMKSKIQSIKLNPDCTMEKGIVITENIAAALKILKSRNVVILKGVIGCGKTHALKAVQNHYQKNNWETAWVESQNFHGKISHEKPSIILCDNLFGRFGRSVFSQDALNQTEEFLKKTEKSEQTIKVVIGIHTHVYDEVNKNFNVNFLHQKNITVEMDKLSEAETLLIFKEQLKKGHCKMDSGCWFKHVGFQSVFDKLSKNQGHIGGPFLSLMYCNQHELFSDEAFSINPVKTLMQYIEKMKNDSLKLYYCLVYMMCVQQHDFEKEPTEWAGQISAEITKHDLMDLAKTSAKTSGLLHVDTKRATPAHELLTTVLFKSAIKERELVIPVLQKCNIDVFIQLLRPTDSTHSDLYLEFTYTDLSQISRDVGKRCAYRLAQKYTKQEIAHPLMKVEFVKNKYELYLKREPKYLKGFK